MFPFTKSSPSSEGPLPFYSVSSWPATRISNHFSQIRRKVKKKHTHNKQQQRRETNTRLVTTRPALYAVSHSVTLRVFFFSSIFLLFSDLRVFARLKKKQTHTHTKKKPEKKTRRTSASHSHIQKQTNKKQKQRYISYKKKARLEVQVDKTTEGKGKKRVYQAR